MDLGVMSEINRLGKSMSNEGRFNEVRMYDKNGNRNWNPGELDPNSVVRVSCWGAGGAGGCSNSSGSGYGGGAGGLAIKEFTYAEIKAIMDANNGSVPMVIGAGSTSYNSKGGNSSFGGVISATGGNSGANNAINQGSNSVYGVGGLGVGGDINHRGGEGGNGNINSSSGYGGGGGSAPGPNGDRAGFKGGVATSYGGGGGAGIGGIGGYGSGNGGGGGGGSLGNGGPLSGQAVRSRNSREACGGQGLLVVGAPGPSQDHQQEGNSGSPSSGLILEPNRIIFGGAGGAGGLEWTSSAGFAGQNGGAGGGGGGINRYTSSTSGYHYLTAGHGGLLGGGGGAGQYNNAGHGGNAGGGGGCGYGNGNNNNGKSYGGHGLIIIQFRTARKF